LESANATNVKIFLRTLESPHSRSHRPP